MTDPRQEAASILRQQGFTFASISQMLGVSESSIHRWLKPDYAERQRAKARQLKERYRGTCQNCGKRTTGCNGPGHAPKLCIRCTNNAKKYWTADKVIDAIRRFAEINGRPPVAIEWRTADPTNGYPTKSSVYAGSGNESAPFPTWAAAIEAAGFPRPKVGQYQINPRPGDRLAA